ncbi:MAG: hypothetical protein K0R39_1709 [Symbiobacteriaceae bacterium]|jgi:hypothetical protein|nr:hypothetical protein [Symbiobacteriaceae bacterium]
MKDRIVALSLFYIGVALMLVHTTLPFLWELARIPWAYPLVSTNGILAVLSGFTPPIGAGLLLVAGIIYGRQARS